MKQLKTMLLEEAAFYDAQMNEIKLRMYAEQLSAISITDVDRAMRYYRSQPGRRQMPMPADLIARIKQPDDDDSASRDVAARIVGSVRKHGYTQSEDAREYIGPVGWEVVRRLGGWTAVCQSMHDRDIPTLTAQYRDLAKSVIQRARAGLGDTPPALPEPAHASFGALASSVIKRIDNTRKPTNGGEEK